MRPNAELADLLGELAALHRTGRRDRFRARAYDRAARVIRALPVDVTEMEEAEMRRLGGVGSAIATMISEYRTSGTIGLLESLRSEEPRGFGALLRLPLIGVRDARTLAQSGFGDIDALRAAAASPSGLDAVGERLAWRVRESLRRADLVADEGLPLPAARREADDLAVRLTEVCDADGVTVAGAVRRSADIVGDLDLVVVAGAPGDALAAALSSRAVVRVLDRRAGVADVVTATGLPGRLWFADSAGAGAALVHATGSGAHVEALCRAATTRGLSLRADGLFEGDRRLPCPDESAVYAALGLPFVAPQLREGTGEVAAAREGRMPRPVEVSDVRGDLHVHTDWSGDGKHSLDTMVRAAAARGYRYVALTDHAENLTINGMPRETVQRRRAEIAQLREVHPDIAILDGAELNIGLDGGLDYDPDFLAEFDVCVASIHSHMDRDRSRQTDRVLAAIANPAVHVVGHLTGRIIGHRPGYDVDVVAIAQAAAATGTALEVNGSPRRLDIAGETVRTVIEAGATVAVCSDAHTTDELSYIDDAVSTARRGWATAGSVVNCREREDFLSWAAAPRG